ncbi:hypothetical protein F5Y16DRAFT_402321 [Xylariaceae sp. FL0255]|nr:hypothetical protein F5Y16DRAFT_402321 [Xylariaceae sp. FL0255]
MSSVKVLKTIGVGKGMTMRITIDENEAEDSVNRYAMDTVCTGEEILPIPPHWFKHHAGHLSVVEGRAEFTLNGEKVILKPGDPPVFVARRVVHSFRSFPGEPVILRERPDPAGLYKALFFNDVFSKGQLGSFWHLLRAFYDGDSYIALPLNSRILDQAFISVFGALAHLFAPRKPTEL